jgi:hypothetical protein
VCTGSVHNKDKIQSAIFHALLACWDDEVVLLNQAVSEVYLYFFYYYCSRGFDSLIFDFSVVCMIAYKYYVKIICFHMQGLVVPNLFRNGLRNGCTWSRSWFHSRVSTFFRETRDLLVSSIVSFLHNRPLWQHTVPIGGVVIGVKVTFIMRVPQD